jgi:DNA-binding NarL/FixJ family response regulator
MEDQKKTKPQLINELAILRQRIAKLEKSKNRQKSTKKALLENEQRFRMVYENVPLGYQSLEAGDVVEAINSIQGLRPDVAILDIRMPGGNGIGVLKAIREKNINTKVIMLTSYPYPKYRKKCMEVGADFFFDKSTEFKKICEVLKQAAVK